MEAARTTDGGSTLVVDYVASECDDQGTVSVDASQDEVQVTIVRRSLFAGSCSDVAVQVSRKIPLAEPLGTREVLDTSCRCAVEVQR